MSEYASVDDLFIGDEPESEDVILPNGKVVKVRGLSRYEYMLSGKNIEEGDGATFEMRTLRYGIVEPKLTEAQVEKWYKSSTSKVMAPITEAIRRLSGLGEDADKSEVSEV